jgi:serine/threonine-protein kinase
LLRREEACDRFEQGWRRGERPDLEDYLFRDSGRDADEQFADLLTIELTYRRRLGEKPIPEEYARRFPDLAGCVQSLLLTEFPVALSNQIHQSTESARGREESEGAIESLPVVPGYELLGVLGRGGMGVVYLARHLRLGRPCALKMISAGEFADPELSARFLAEATTEARLRHPSIVQVYHIGDHAGRP